MIPPANQISSKQPAINRTVIPLQPNHRTFSRFKAQREAEKKRLIKQIGINQEDAPLFEEELRFLAYQESLKG